MKKILIILFVYFIIVQGQGNSEIDQEKKKYKEPKDKKDAALAWVEFLQEYAPTYTGTEIAYRQKTFFENFDKMVEQNLKNQGFNFGMNQFSDLTNEEFAALPLFTSFKDVVGTVTGSLNPAELAATTALGITPGAVDWRTTGAVTPVKNQGSCGACWAFGAAAALESLNFIKNAKLVSFSEQQLVDCTYGKTWGNNGCSGGWPGYAFTYTASKGIETSVVYPYKARVQRCAYSSSKVVFKNTGYVDVYRQTPAVIQSLVAKQPLVFALQADTSFFQLYSSGILKDPGCQTGTDASPIINHAVTTVGFDQDLTTGQNYWIIKNSWSTLWGDKGYIKIAFDPADTSIGICGSNYWNFYPTK